MREITLEQFAKDKGNNAAARALGCTPPAITFAIGSGRTIMVRVEEDGATSAYEVRPFPAKQRSNAA